MVKRLQVLATCWMACVWVNTAHAAEFDVGRATVVFSSDGWTEAQLPDSGLKYGGEREGSLAAESKLLMKVSPQHGVEAVALLRSNRGVAGARMTYTRRCEPAEGFYAEGTSGDALRVVQCLRVFPLYTASSLLADMGEAVQSAMKGVEDQLPEGMYAITSEYWNTTGSALHVYVLLAPSIPAPEVPLDVALPKGIKASHVVWGRELNHAVKDSVNSIFGTMKFPDAVFATSPEQK
jgi:hypothetical protein